MQTPPTNAAPKRPGGPIAANAAAGAAVNPGHPTRSALLPFAGNGRALLRKGHFGPAIATAVLVAVLLSRGISTVYYIYALAAYLGLAGYYAVYVMCGKSRAWYASAAAALVTAAIIKSWLFVPYEVVFRMILPGDVFGLPATAGFVRRFVANLFGAGLMEEAIKATPLLVLWALTKHMPSPLRQRLGVTEPLDGIVLGAAAGFGFTMAETLGQYMVNEMVQGVQNGGTVDAGMLAGIKLVIPRVAKQAFGHTGYASVVGYSIGLAALYPKARWRALPIGYLAGSALHALWNASTQGPARVLQVPVMLLVWTAVVLCILKARQLSPLRHQNFATELAPAGAAAVAGGRAAPAPAPAVAAAASPFTLRVGGGPAVPLSAGALLYERDLPGLRARRTDGVVAEVGRNPKDPSVLGLTNHSHEAWTVEAAPGSAPGRVVASGQTVRLSAGLRLALGGGRAAVVA